jgi:hypothetical protein
VSCVPARRWFGFGPTRCLQCSQGFTLTPDGTCDCAPGYGTNPSTASDPGVISTFWPGTFFGFGSVSSDAPLCQPCPDGTTSSGGAPRSTTCQPLAEVTPVTPTPVTTPVTTSPPPPYASVEAATAPTWPYSGDARDASGTVPAAPSVAISAPPPFPFMTTAGAGAAPTIAGTTASSEAPVEASPAPITADSPPPTVPATTTSIPAPAVPSGTAEFTKPGPFNWTAPLGVTSIAVFCVGGGGAALGANAGGGGGAGSMWMNSIPVTPGVTYTGAVGAPGSAASRDGGDSSMVLNTVTLAAQGGKGTNTTSPGAGGCYTSYVEDSLKETVESGGACGGAGGAGSSVGPGGGGAAGGFQPSSDAPPCPPGTGPGAAPKAGCVSDGGLPGGAVKATKGVWEAFGGAGVGLKGPAAAAGAGAGGAAPAGVGQVFGGGAGGLRKGSRRGLGGACRIVYGAGRSYPHNAA